MNAIYRILPMGASVIAISMTVVWTWALALNLLLSPFIKSFGNWGLAVLQLHNM